MNAGLLLNAALSHEIAKAGHTQTIVIGDAGLPVPVGVKCIDLAVSPGLPGFPQVLQAVLSELVVESAVCALEIKEKNPAMDQIIQGALAGYPIQYVSHESLKELSKKANVIVRTGEITSYANVILVAGVNF